jgi:radical SAM superfamily enzyme YgiQ (UPF0313 family)
MRRLKIYLADLTHTGVGIATEIMPLNVGLVASYARRRFEGAVEIEVFKYPEDLRDAIVLDPPDVLGCSNYTWNANLSYHFVRQARALKPDLVTVFGGTNYPFDPVNQRRFLEARPDLDLHTFYEGELAFANVVERLLGANNRSAALCEPIPGCQSIDGVTGRFLNGGSLPRLKALDEIPSPYVSGILDRFFDGRLTPILETARGCPFSCNFCNAGDAYFNKMNLFSEEYIREEWEYVARRAAAFAGHMILCDNNFGMIPRDARIAELMCELKERYGWPRSVTAWTGKNSKERVIEVTRRLGDTLSVSMSVQSLDAAVLRNIKRDNIKLDHYRAIARDLSAQGRPQHAELIVPLPDETWSSHVAALRDLLDSAVANVVTHTLQMLHGTPYKDDESYVAKHGFVLRHRIVPRDFGIYDGEHVFDTEEVAIGTKTFSPEEYLESRKLLLVIDLCYNGELFGALKRYIVSRGVRCSDWIWAIYRAQDAFVRAAWKIFDDFTRETQDELWESERALVEFYFRPENYARLLSGEAGGNILWKHKVRMIAEAADSWIDSVFTVTRALLGATAEARQEAELDALRRFIGASVRDAFRLSAPGTPLVEELSIDVGAWLGDGAARPLEDYRRTPPVRIAFRFDAEQQELRCDAASRYGDNLHGWVKLVQRLGSTHRLMRQPAVADVASVDRA